MADDNIVIKTLNGGPHDGEEFDIHRDNLRIKPIINVRDEDGNWSSYAPDENGQYVWLPDPDNSWFSPKWYVCDDNGNVISEESSEQDVFETLDKFNDVANYH